MSYEAALDAASPERGFEPRSADDIYILYTGGTTGMPKGVLWRQEDIFFAAMGGGGWGAAPITHAEELAGRLNPDDAGRVVMLVVAPLMHGNAQWVMWNAFMMGGTAVLFTGHRYDPDALWRLIGDEGVVSVGLVGDAMARPLVDTLVTAPPARTTPPPWWWWDRAGPCCPRPSRTSWHRSFPTSWSSTTSAPVRAVPRARSRPAPAVLASP